MWTR